VVPVDLEVRDRVLPLVPLRRPPGAARVLLPLELPVICDCVAGPQRFGGEVAVGAAPAGDGRVVLVDLAEVSHREIPGPGQVGSFGR
jgi:hypothetical protein